MTYDLREVSFHLKAEIQRTDTLFGFRVENDKFILIRERSLRNTTSL